MSFAPFDSTSRDAILLRSLAITPTLVPSAWPSSSSSPSQASPQPALVHARVLPKSGFSLSAQLDQLDSDTVSYATLASAFSAHTNSPENAYQRVELLAEDLACIALWDCRCDEIELAVELTNAVLLGTSASVLIRRVRSDYDTSSSPRPLLRNQIDSKEDRLELKDLRVSCLVGVLEYERLEPQSLVVNILCWPTRLAGTCYSQQTLDSHIDMSIGIRPLASAAVGHINRSSFFTVEALAASLADTVLSIPQPNLDPPTPAIRKVRVRVEKPSAIAFAQGAGVELTRSWSHRPTNTTRLLPSHSSPSRFFGSIPGSHLVYLGLGSNIGDRLQQISSALDSLCRSIDAGGADAQILDTSFVYESEPMYKIDQPRFLNAACKISTPLGPFELLKVLKSIEHSAGRDLDSMERNGPRPIDLDILLFDSQTIEHPTLCVPHIGLPSRPFVLEPLHDIAAQLVHPLSELTIATLRARLSQPGSPLTLRRIHPLPSPALELSGRTHIMSIVNCTPDSFSSSLSPSSPGVTESTRLALEQLERGADILDVGGMSTRPGAEEVSAAEEIRRTVPVIQALRSIHGVRCHISIDTMKAVVAEAAVRAGATMVNDVSGGQADAAMFSTVARLGVPVVLMHMRGDPKTMSRMTTYVPDVVEGVRTELGQCVKFALAAGVRRWNIILDPGVGFAKDLDGNCVLLDCMPQLVDERGPLRGFPLLVGPSRKSFVGTLIGRASVPQDRIFGTAAACAVAVMGGAQVVRVHDTAEIRDVVRVLDGIRSRTRSQLPTSL